MMKLKYLVYVLILFTLLSTRGSAQISFLGGGVEAGLGSFSSAAPSVSGYMTAAYIDLQYYSLPKIYFKPQIFYSRDIKILLPEDRYGKYYPFVYGVSLSAMSADSLSSSLMLEYGGGLVLLRDQTFSDLDNYSPGAQLNASLFLNVADYSSSRLQLGAAVSYGQTFGETTPSYLFYVIDCRLRMK